MGLGDWLKKTYGNVDQSIFGGKLPGGAIPGVPYIAQGDNLGNVPQGTSTFNGAPSYGSGAPPYVAELATGGPTPTPGGTPTPSKGIGDWIKSNPGEAAKIGLTALGTAATLYGASKDRGVAQQQLTNENQQAQQTYQLQKQQYELNALNAQRQYESDTAERMRHRAAINQILAMNKTDATGGNARAQPIQME